MTIEAVGFENVLLLFVLLLTVGFGLVWVMWRRCDNEEVLFLRKKISELTQSPL